ncbi:citrate/2-methylcitrate synthase [Streptomyces asiaticus]|uniref:citrate/2-methylcitrate synthase n=1 Tax=Streptomyces asiaticus TaxID=114695 RepID=UPI003F6718F9
MVEPEQQRGREHGREAAGEHGPDVVGDADRAEPDRGVEEFGGEAPGWALRAGTALERALAEGRSRPVPMNIDGATAIVYSELGFPPELGRGLFVLSRSVGILSHAWEEKSGGARIKGPLPRRLLPSYEGPAPRDLNRPESGGNGAGSA